MLIFVRIDDRFLLLFASPFEILNNWAFNSASVKTSPSVSVAARISGTGDNSVPRGGFPYVDGYLISSILCACSVLRQTCGDPLPLESFTCLISSIAFSVPSVNPGDPLPVVKFPCQLSTASEPAWARCPATSSFSATNRTAITFLVRSPCFKSEALSPSC